MTEESAANILLVKCAAGDWQDSIRSAIAQGADINCQNGAPLRFAVTNKHHHIVVLLHELGANVQIGNNAAIKIAAGNEDNYMVDLLVKYGADIKAANDVYLGVAIRHNDKKRIMELLADGVSSEAKDEALIKALEIGNLELTKLLHSHGANLSANDNAALKQAIQYNNTDVIAFLLDNGVSAEILDINNNKLLHELVYYTNNLEAFALLFERGMKLDTKNSENAGWQSLPQSNLINAHEELEKLAKLYPQYPYKTVRSVLYQSAALAARCDFTPDQIADFAKATLESSFTINPDTLPAGRNTHPMQPELAKENRIKFIDRIATKGYSIATNVHDMLAEFVEAIILPQLLVHCGQDGKDSYISEMGELVPLAAKILFHGKRLDEIFSMSDEWHIAGAIPDTLRPLRTGGKWQPIIPDIVTPFTVKTEDGETPIIIRALVSHKDLENESHQLRHCVGDGTYAARCLNGHRHILSIQAAGRSLATAEVATTNDPKKPLITNQIYGMDNRLPSQQVREAWDWFNGQLKSKDIKFNIPANDQWGETEESKKQTKAHPVHRQIGFIPTQENIDACLDHYRDKLKIKEKTQTYRQREHPTLGSPRTLEESYRWRSSIGNSDFITMLEQRNLMGQWLEKTMEMSNPYPARRQRQIFDFGMDM